VFPVGSCRSDPKFSFTRTDKGVIVDADQRAEQQTRVADLINDVSATTLAQDYILGEMRHFFRGANPEEFIDNLLSKINSSVLSLPNITRISQKFVASQSSGGTEHPFCLMYNLGLIGYVKDGAAGIGQRQIFMKPYEFNWQFEHILPVDPKTIYLVHPALHQLIKKKNYRFKYNRVRIGDGFPWTEYEVKTVEREKIKIFISYSHADAVAVERIAEYMDDSLNEKSVIHDIWLDKWKIRSGPGFLDQIAQGLRDSDYLILACSENSLKSPAVEIEWKTKFAQKFRDGQDRIFPILLRDTPVDDLPEYLNGIHAYRIENEDAKLITQLVDDILFWRDQTELSS
jgi:hypothetical protein